MRITQTAAILAIAFLSTSCKPVITTSSIKSNDIKKLSSVVFSLEGPKQAKEFNDKVSAKIISSLKENRILVLEFVKNENLSLDKETITDFAIKNNQDYIMIFELSSLNSVNGYIGQVFGECSIYSVSQHKFIWKMKITTESQTFFLSTQNKFPLELSIKLIEKLKSDNLI